MEKKGKINTYTKGTEKIPQLVIQCLLKPRKGGGFYLGKCIIITVWDEK